MNYYNEFDPKAAAWLRELIKQGLLPAGDVDTRSITEVSPHDLKHYTQCHFFAGIGGWSLALQLAGWPEDLPVWSGSCPCQPFSCAGLQLGTDDERHLWPVLRSLIGECRPPVVFGEQVASKAGRNWLAGVFADLETLAYHRAGADLCAAGVGSPHIRQRLYWVALSTGIPGGQVRPVRTGCDERERDGKEGRERSECSCGNRGVGDPINPRLEGHAGHEPDGDQPGRVDPNPVRPASPAGGVLPAYSRWDRFTLIPCADGKSRRIEPCTAPLAHGVPARVVRLRGYGNAIVPPLAAQFIASFIEAANPCNPVNNR